MRTRLKGFRSRDKAWGLGFGVWEGDTQDHPVHPVQPDRPVGDPDDRPAGIVVEDLGGHGARGRPVQMGGRLVEMPGRLTVCGLLQRDRERNPH